MATFQQKFWEHSSASLSKVGFLAVGVIFSFQVVFPISVIHAQEESGTGSVSGPPSPSIDSDLQYFVSPEHTPVSSVSESSSDEEPAAQTTSSEKPYVGDEGIPVMAETVVEGAAIDSFPDPFDVGPQVVVNDPWESFNEDVFQFNYDMDRYLLKPVAKGYNFVVPPDVQGSLANAFDNMGFMTRFLNSLFQGKYGRAGIETKRFLINSTVGVAGLFDVAKYVFETEAPPTEDTGQTLAMYGMESGPFLILPFMPPLTVRDAVGYAGDIALNPINYFIPFFPNLGINAESTVNDRSINLDKFAGIEESTVDLYGAVRAGYFDSRAKDLQE